MKNLTVERRLGDWMRGVLPHSVAEFVMFGLKMAWACLFAGLMLGVIILTAVFWPEAAQVARYDFLVVFAVAVQVVLLVAAAVLSALFLYLAENVGTLTGTWLYSGTVKFSFASLGKLGSWYLLLFVSFVQVSLVYRHVLVSDGTQEE